MNEEQKKKVQEHINSLPENVQNAILEFDWLAPAQDIARRFNLSVSQIDAFIAETMFVVVGMADANDYENNLIENVGVGVEDAKRIELAAENSIFSILQKIAYGSPGQTEQPDRQDEVFQSAGIILDNTDTPYEERALENAFVHNKPVGGYSSRDPYREPIN